MSGFRRVRDVFLLGTIFVGPAFIFWILFHGSRIFLFGDWSMKLDGPQGNMAFWMTIGALVVVEELLGFGVLVGYMSRKLEAVGMGVASRVTLFSGVLANCVVGALGWSILRIGVSELPQISLFFFGLPLIVVFFLPGGFWVHAKFANGIT